MRQHCGVSPFVIGLLRIAFRSLSFLFDFIFARRGVIEGLGCAVAEASAGCHLMVGRPRVTVGSDRPELAAADLARSGLVSSLGCIFLWSRWHGNADDPARRVASCR